MTLMTLALMTLLHHKTQKRQKTREKQQKRGDFDANSVKNTL